MQNEKKVLGRGLAALIPQGYANETGNNSNEFTNSYEIKNLGVFAVEANPYQPRRQINPSDLNELSESIKEHGVLQPIVVRVNGNKYQIVAGERRWQAAKKAGLQFIPALIKNLNDKETFEIALIENIQRAELSAIDEAGAYERMIKEFGHTHDSLAKRVGKSRSYITNTLRLLNLPEDVKQLLIEKKISAGHARTLINSAEPSKIANDIIKENWSVRKTENEIRNNPHSKSRHQRLIREGSNKYFEKDSDLLEVEKILSDSLNTKVYINDTVKGGQIIIEFTMLEQLDNIIARISNSSKICL